MISLFNDFNNGKAPLSDNLLLLRLITVTDLVQSFIPSPKA